MSDSALNAIISKRDGATLESTQINQFVRDVTRDHINDAQIAAFCMAVFIRGMSTHECTNLTMAMRDSGFQLDWNDLDLDGPVVDKHSTGGVGDWVSLALGPILAACGAYVPMISGRGLGHTGGTVDKLESIPGYNAQPDIAQLRQVVKDSGIAIVGQSAQIAPADRKMYAVRNISGTVESLSLIAASILSKKLASGLNYLVLDVKTGSGATTGNAVDAQTLAHLMLDICNQAKTKANVLITDMNVVPSKSVGNALELREAITYLTNSSAHPRQQKIINALGEQVLIGSGIASDLAQARKKIDHALNSGAAAERFAKMVSALGGATDFLERFDYYLPKSTIIRPVLATQSGFLMHQNLRAIGQTIVNLGGGRVKGDEQLNHAVGISDLVEHGSPLNAGDPMLVIHASSESEWQCAAKQLEESLLISDSPSNSSDVIHRILSPQEPE
ncbi:MAG TPA: thymidine phosphorylase [Arenimonas sp.]|nr:thymidine phosphorylase [Arenimonas sp.]